MPHSDNPPSLRMGTQALERATQVLLALGGNQREGLRLTDLSERCGLDLSTTQRLVKGLVRLRLADRDADKRYRLGSLTFELGLAAGQNNAIVSRMKPVVKEVAERTGDTAYLVMRSGDEAVCFVREEGDFQVRALIPAIGGRRPIGLGGASLHILSQLKDRQGIIERNAKIYARYPSSSAEIVSMSATEALRAGYGISHARDIPGVSNAGIAVPNPNGEPFAGIGITCISPRLTHEHCDKAVAIMREALARAGY